MTRILGIDPGSRITGFGVIEMTGLQTRHIASGCVRTRGESLPERLDEIFAGIETVVGTYHPDEMAIESVFMHRNAGSALKLGQARGAAICAATRSGLAISEYAPREVKQAVVGKGGATKEQVQHMVCVLLGLRSSPQADAADALAVALCHGHTRETLARSGADPRAGKRR